MPVKQYVVLKECIKKRRNRVYYKVVFKVDATKEDAAKQCLDYISKQKYEFMYHIVITEYGGYMKYWSGKSW